MVAKATTLKKDCDTILINVEGSYPVVWEEGRAAPYFGIPYHCGCKVRHVYWRMGEDGSKTGNALGMCSSRGNVKFCILAL
ncbi:hypothetical protein TNCT_567401 [Trichonephila clavata]|uniref:Uncharacterized protein n=1 Tax=Trichonephila clavata TaxID=2740835 RepID=A0A8X6I5F9_TRICU|nr:hypothetical protein TNCT_567401 [Trichonephila clavata]